MLKLKLNKIKKVISITIFIVVMGLPFHSVIKVYEENSHKIEKNAKEQRVIEKAEQAIKRIKLNIQNFAKDKIKLK